MSRTYPRGGRWLLSYATVFAVALLLPLPTRADGPAVLINEIMWDGVEYLELYNTTTEAVSLSGWTLTRQQAGGTPKTIVTFSSADSLTGQGYFLIEKQDEATTLTGNKVVSALTLVNTGELLTLTASDGSVVDRANQLGSWYAGANTDAGVAMERTSSTDGQLSTSWHTATAATGGRQGTPGAANSAPAVNQPPTAVIQSPTTALVGQAVTFNAEDSSDPEGSALTFAWSFGDSTSASGAEATHTYTAAGSYTVRLSVSDSEHEAEATRALTVTAPVYSNQLVINEILPNPVGSDTGGEFIELRNLGHVSVDLAGWQLDDNDGGSAPYTIPAGTTIGAGAIRVFLRSETKIALNNDGDSARLLDPSQGLRASVAYPSSLAEGVSYNLPPQATAATATAYVASTTTTPGSTNVVTIPVEEEEDEAEATTVAATTNAADTKKGRVAGTAVTTVPLADVRDEAKGTHVQTEGVVSVPPGVLGQHIFYVAGSGIQVYLAADDFPPLQLGDTVQLTAEVSTNRGEARLKLASAAAIKKTTSAAPPTPHRIETGEVDEGWEGSLVVIQGHVTETSGDIFYVDDGSGEAKVVIAQTTTIDKPKMNQGTAVTITGIVSETTSGFRLLPRFQEDIRLGLVAGLTSFPATGTVVPLAACLVSSLLLLAWGRYSQEPLCRVTRNL